MLGGPVWHRLGKYKGDFKNYEIIGKINIFYCMHRYIGIIMITIAIMIYIIFGDIFGHAEIRIKNP
jgi:hypothetical protein